MAPSCLDTLLSNSQTGGSTSSDVWMMFKGYSRHACQYIRTTRMFLGRTAHSLTSSIAATSPSSEWVQGHNDVTACMRLVGSQGIFPKKNKQVEQIDDCYDLELACNTSNAQHE
jgi:hypothetical protein